MRMKTYIYYKGGRSCALTILLALLLLTACNKDSLVGYVPATDDLPVVRNTLAFSVHGGTESVEVETAETVTAQLSADWCTATVDGSVVTVTAEANTRYEGRTALLTLQAGSKRRMLAVQQAGIIVGTIPADSRYVAMAGETIVYDIPHDQTMTVTTRSAWIHPTVDGQQLKVVVDGNEGGHLRRGFVASACAGVEDTLWIAQYDLAEDIVGSYYMAGESNGAGGPLMATRFDIVQRNDSLLMHFTNQKLWQNTYIPVRLDEGMATLIFSSGMTLYRGGSTVETAFFYDNTGAVTTSSSRGAQARMTYNATTGYHTAVMETYNWPGHVLGGFLIRSSVGSGLVVTNLLQLANPVLTRVGPEGTTLSDN